MPWRLPPPIWLASGRTTRLARLLHLAAVAWRLAKWSVGAGIGLAVLHLVFRPAGSGWLAGAALGWGLLSLAMWERYGLADTALVPGRLARWAITLVLVVLAAAAAWLTALAAAGIALAWFGA